MRAAAQRSAEPGAAILRCWRASSPAGATSANRVVSLFFQPLTTSASPVISAAKPIRATSAGSSYLAWPTLVSSMPARRKNSVAVAPGIRQVTVTPLSFSSSRSAAAKLSRKALLPL